MSDTSPTPIPTAVSDPSPTASVPDAASPEHAGSPPADVPDMPVAEPQAAPPAPVDPPPAGSGAEPAGAEVPPESGAAPPEAVAPVVDPTPAPIPVVESVPATGSEVTSAVVDTPAAALATLGPGAGVPEGTTDVLTPVSSMAPPMVQHPILGEIEHPGVTIQRLRRKLAEYGDECLKAVQAELEHLQKIFEE